MLTKLQIEDGVNMNWWGVCIFKQTIKNFEIMSRDMQVSFSLNYMLSLIGLPHLYDGISNLANNHDSKMTW